MNVIITKNYNESCKKAANIFKQVISENPSAKLGLATGSTAVAVYDELIKMHNNDGLDFSNIRTVNLDEYCGLEKEHEQSYRYFMNVNFFNHVNINNTFVAKGTGDVQANAKELDKMVYAGGNVDIQLLGIGANGHIAFNEPGENLIACAHVEQLTQSTINANARFFDNVEDVPTKAITMGMANIMSAKKIVIIATGLTKADAIKGLIFGENITTQNPSTLLKMHSDVHVIIDEEIAAIIGLNK